MIQRGDLLIRRELSDDRDPIPVDLANPETANSLAGYIAQRSSAKDLLGLREWPPPGSGG